VSETALVTRQALTPRTIRSDGENGAVSRARYAARYLTTRSIAAEVQAE